MYKVASAKKKKNVKKKMVSTYAKSFGKRMQKYREFAEASKLGHKITTAPLRPSDLKDYNVPKTKFGYKSGH